jgi:CcmD family protein
MPPVLIDLTAEIHNLAYLFYAHIVLWTFVAGYGFVLARRGRKLRQELEELKTSLENDR